MLFGGSVFALYAGIYFWFPKFFGRRLHEGWARLHFVLMFIGFNMTFFVQHRLGLEACRRVADYLPSDGFTFLNQISTIGSFLLGASTLPFPLERVADPAARRRAAGDNPWDGHTLEWASLSSARGELRRGAAPIRSERPVWDANHPDAPSTNGSSSGEAGPDPDVRQAWRDAPLESRIFGLTAAYFVLAGVVYAVSTDERSGATPHRRSRAFGYAAWFWRHIAPARKPSSRPRPRGGAVPPPREHLAPRARDGEWLVITGLAIGLARAPRRPYSDPGWWDSRPSRPGVALARRRQGSGRAGRSG